MFEYLKKRIYNILNKRYTVAWFSLIFGLVITAILVNLSKQSFNEISNKEFQLYCTDLNNKIHSRLHAHASVLRSGSALFATSDSVSRKEWQIFISSSELERNLPGIQGVGYSVLISNKNLQTHISNIKSQGFPNYKIHPEVSREIYTSIIFLEPFKDRNLRAFGYDMFSEPIRRKAMESARDNNLATLSGKVQLVQETEKDVQPGTLMYVPVYKNGEKIETVEDRRKSIRGWIYSPYRMIDLMDKVVSEIDTNRNKSLRIKIYDETNTSEEGLLYDSHKGEKLLNYGLNYVRFVNFNGKLWTIKYSQFDYEDIYNSNNKVTIIFFTGSIISLLIFIIFVVLIDTKTLNKNLIESKEQNRIILLKQVELINDLSNSEQKLKTEISTKDQLFSIVAHDLKGPIGALNSLVEEIINDFNYYDQKELLHIFDLFQKTTSSTMSLLTNLLDWARSQKNDIKYNFKNYNVKNQINNIIEIFRPIALTKNIEIVFNNFEDFEVFADIDTVNTAFRNIISNAIKFSKFNSKIEIKFEEFENKYLVFEVKDNGVGLSQAQIKDIFNQHFSETSIGTNNETGTGLGLILCKDFIEKNGGKIWVESKLDVGTTFFFTLQRAIL